MDPPVGDGSFLAVQRGGGPTMEHTASWAWYMKASMMAEGLRNFSSGGSQLNALGLQQQGQRGRT
jgi:hypothetical protein